MNDCENVCEEIQEFLEGYALDLLGEDERRRCDEHLRSCGACRGLLAEVRDTVRLLENLPREASPSSDFEARILSLAAKERPAPSRRWGRVGRAAAAAGWLIAVGVGASAMTAAYLGGAGRDDASAGLLTLLEAQERRISSLMDARVDDRAAVRDAVATELTGRLEGIRSELGSLRDEAGRLAGNVSRLEPLYEEASTLSKDLEESRARGARLERGLSELAAGLEATAMAIEAQDRALGDLAARVAAYDGPTDDPTRPVALAAAGPLTSDPLTRAPDVSVAVPLGSRGGGGGSTLAQMQAQTPWDAAFKMASSVVRNRGREIPGQIREYQDDLFRIYSAKN